MTVEFNTPQRRLIRELLDVQIRSLRELMQGESEEDLPLFCYKNNLTIEFVKENLERELVEYKRVWIKPSKLLTLSPERLSVFKHILFNNLKYEKYKTLKSEIWKKLNTFEIKPINLN